jgi:hypothetical protein
MKHSYVVSLALMISLVMLLSACSGPPTESIQRAEQAKAEAAALRADQFAPDSWAAAEKAMQEANVKISEKAYGDAANILLKARSNYIKARDVAKDKRTELAKKITGYQTYINIHLKTDLKENPAAAKLAPARKKELDAEIAKIEESNAKIGEQLKNGQLADADYLGQTTQRRIYEIQQEFLKK